MKQFDDSSKKLIKNVAALLVSALILIAATIAWFANNARVDVNAIQVGLEAARSCEYYAMDTASVLTTIDSTTGLFTLNPVKDLDTQVADTSSWTKTSDWRVNPLYPGVYRAYMMKASGAGIKPSLHVDVATTNDDSAHTVLKSVYLQAAAYTESGGNYTQVGSTIYGSLFDLMSDNNVLGSAIDTVFSQTAVNDAYYVVINVGIPGEDVATTHETLQTLGATVTLSGVSGSTAS